MENKFTLAVWVQHQVMIFADEALSLAKHDFN